MKAIKPILILFLISFLLFGKNTAAQKQKTNPEKQALFIYNFFKFVEWSNFDELNSFNVGVIGDDKNLVYDELLKISKTETAKNLPLKITRLKNLTNLNAIQLLYFDKSAALKFDQIYAAIGKKHILLVSKDYPYGKSMINFVMDENNVQYELNEQKCEAAGLRASKVLTLIAVKSEKEWNQIISKYENLANTDQETVEISTKELNKLVKEQKRLLNEIGSNTKKLEVQKEKLKKQEADLALKGKLIEETKAEIDITKKEVEKQKRLILAQLYKIKVQQENLSLLDSNVMLKQNKLYYQQKELKEQQLELEKEALNLIAIQKEYGKIESALKNKELLVGLQGQTINAQGDEITTKSDKIEKQESIIWLSVLFLLIVSALGIMAYRSYRLKNKANIQIITQKEKIEGQHKILEEQHKEITDSINYAKRIQEAIMPPMAMIKDALPDSFVLYEPKDIVAGDFYWMESVTSNEKNGLSTILNSPLVLFAAADCTGHGVPGAMVSVVCNNAMNRAVREFNLTEPNKILDKTRDIVLETFERSTEDVNDGMDIAMCTLNTITKELSFSGANNGLYLIRNKEFTEIKPDKQPIGKYHNSKPFSNHTFQLEKGDVIYTFTDGYADQFGGPKGKKFMYKPFRKLLLEIHEKPMDEQHQILMDTFNKWKGGLEQIDDLCIIGVRI